MKKEIQLSDHFDYGRLLRFTVPSIIMMIFMSIYSVVDGFFVSNFAGKTPFAAINLIMPFLMILGTVGFMFGTGGSAIVSQNLGEGKKELANKHFSLFVYTSTVIAIVLAVIGIVFARPIAALLGAEGEILDDAVLYARIYLLALPFNVLQMLFQSFFVTAEKPKFGLIVTVMSGATNIVMDALLVGLLPQEFKLAGAAVATALSQIIGGLVPIIYFSRENSSLLRLCKTEISGIAIVRACTNGSSEFMSNISMSVVSMLYNMQLLKYAGENGIAAYGSMMYVSMIFSAAFVGYSIGVAPVTGYHYGAKNESELKGLLKKSLIIIASFSVLMFAASELLAYPLSYVFVGYDAELLDLTVHGFKIFSISFAFMGFSIYSSGFFTSLGDGLTSALISFLRTLVLQVAAVLILPALFEIDGVWWSIAVAEIMAVILSAIFLVIKRKKYRYF